jgi:asparagine synthase (glutamine-hydrolysing)
MYLISRHTRQQVTVALCGAGGDELFAGYPRYRAVAYSRALRWVPRPLLACARGMSGVLPNGTRSTKLRRAAQFLRGFDRDLARQFVRWVYFLDQPEKTRLFSEEYQKSQPGFQASERFLRKCLEESDAPDLGNRVLHLDVQTFLVDNLLEYTDKMSMASALEVRVPYLDYRFVERSLRVPFRYKLRGGTGKAILREAFADLLPEANQQLPKKGFNAPLAVWMRSRLDRYFDEHMSRAAVARQGVLNWDYLQLLRQQHRSGKRDNSYELFAILTFDAWYSKYFS